MNPHEILALAILDELETDRLKFPSMLNAPCLDEVGLRAEKKIGEEQTKETRDMAVNYLILNHCVKSVKRQTGESVFQISDDGVDLLRRHKVFVHAEKAAEIGKNSWTLERRFMAYTAILAAIGVVLAYMQLRKP